MHRKIEKILI